MPSVASAADPYITLATRARRQGTRSVSSCATGGGADHRHGRRARIGNLGVGSSAKRQQVRLPNALARKRAAPRSQKVERRTAAPCIASEVALGGEDPGRENRKAPRRREAASALRRWAARGSRSAQGSSRGIEIGGSGGAGKERICAAVWVALCRAPEMMVGLLNPSPPAEAASLLLSVAANPSVERTSTGWPLTGLVHHPSSGQPVDAAHLHVGRLFCP